METRCEDFAKTDFDSGKESIDIHGMIKMVKIILSISYLPRRSSRLNV
jgi:hypothetical protein